MSKDKPDGVTVLMHQARALLTGCAHIYGPRQAGRMATTLLNEAAAEGDPEPVALVAPPPPDKDWWLWKSWAPYVLHNKNHPRVWALVEVALMTHWQSKGTSIQIPHAVALIKAEHHVFECQASWHGYLARRFHIEHPEQAGVVRIKPSAIDNHDSTAWGSSLQSAYETEKKLAARMVKIRQKVNGPEAPEQAELVLR